MTITINIAWIIIPLWIILGFFVAYKQSKVISEFEDIHWFAFFVAPFWFVGAIIRQVFIEKWK